MHWFARTSIGHSHYIDTTVKPVTSITAAHMSFAAKQNVPKF